MLYKYCDTNGFGILEKSKLRLTKFESFNDPFELVFGIDEDSAPSNIKREYEEDPNVINKWKTILDEQNMVYDNNSLNDIIEKYTEFIIIDHKNIPNILKKQWNDTIGIVCLSETMDVIQMWAHYADNHKGIVVGIDENEIVKDKETLITVCYRDKMVLLPVADLDFNKNIIKYIPDALSRKETKWSYEKEIRLYGYLEEIDEDRQYYVDISPLAIKEIYLGLRSSQETKLRAKIFKQSNEYQHLIICEMKKHEKAFKLIPREIFK